MKNLLSIGEVSKIKGVSHRMLRHYDKLGILIPTYTNEETGYRYYSKNQMIILDLIFICTDLGIPLKQINSYISADGTYNTKEILEDGKKLADKRLKELNKSVFKLNSLSEHFTSTDYSQKIEQPRSIEKRYFLVNEIEKTQFTIELYWEIQSNLYEKILKEQLTSSVNQGQCLIFSENSYKNYIYTEILKPTKKIPNVITIPKGNFLCEIFEDDDFELAYKKYFKQYNKGSILIIADVFEQKISDKIMPLEIQLYKK